MTTSKAEDLAIAQLVYWVPATILALVVTFKHGFGRQLGWIMIGLLGLARLIGNSCQVAYENQADPSTQLITAAAITNSIGMSFLVSVLIGLLTRVIAGMHGAIKIPPRALSLQQLVILASVILGVIGGVDVSSHNDPSEVSTGHDLLKASIVLIAVALAIVIACLIAVLLRMRHVLYGERRLVWTCLIALPFVLVRLTYSLLVIFANTSTFNFYHPNIYIKAFMQVLMEFIIAAIVITAGFVTPAISGDVAAVEESSHGRFMDLRNVRR